MRALLDVNVLNSRCWIPTTCTTRPPGSGCGTTYARDGRRARSLRTGACESWPSPPIPNRVPAPVAAERLGQATATAHHRFWPDAVSLLSPGVVDWRRLIGPKQITDVYLLALAVAHRGRFVTFDARIDSSTRSRR